MKQLIRSHATNSVVGPPLRRINTSLVHISGVTRTWLKFGRHHDAPLDPFELIEVDPNRITCLFDEEDYFEQPIYTTELAGGQWDRYVTDLEAYDLYRSFVAHFEDGVPWSETDLYARVETEAERDDWAKWGCTDMSDFRAHIEEYDRLYERIRRDGYKTQRQLHGTSNRERLGRSPPLAMPPELFEITVVIGPTGRLMFHYQGRHRLAIAKILDLETIPVRVRARHEEWQQTRDAVARGVSTEHDTSHPDLRQL